MCLPTVVEEFLRQAKAAQLFMTSESFIFNDLLDSDLSKAFGGMDRLDMFFPFDPLLLKKSERFETHLCMMKRFFLKLTHYFLVI